MLYCSGEFHLRLRQLEKSLLQALNDAKGKILDDDSVIATLETLKKEADDIGQKVNFFYFGIFLVILDWSEIIIMLNTELI